MAEASAPSIVSISSSTPDGVYGVGSPIAVTVTLSKPATLTGGDLTIPLNDGGSVTIAPFSGSTILTGTYTVASGDDANRLDTTSPLLLADGATLTDADGNDAGLAIPAGALLAFNSNFLIDTSPPTSSVDPLPTNESSAIFTVTWSGQDAPGGSGVAFYNIYDSEDGGPYALWQSNTAQTSATFTGVSGHSYSFYSVATDNVGNLQPAPSAAQATTAVLLPPPPPPPPPTPAPPLVKLSSVVEKTNKKHQLTEVLVTFSGAVNMIEADSINTYRLATAGKKRSYTAKNAGVIKLRSAVYDGSSNTVALTPKKPFALTRPVELLVYGTGVWACKMPTDV